MGLNIVYANGRQPRENVNGCRQIRTLFSIVFRQTYQTGARIKIITEISPDKCHVKYFYCSKTLKAFCNIYF